MFPQLLALLTIVWTNGGGGYIAVSPVAQARPCLSIAVPSDHCVTAAVFLVTNVRDTDVSALRPLWDHLYTGKLESTISGATKPVPLSKIVRTNSAGFWQRLLMRSSGRLL